MKIATLISLVIVAAYSFAQEPTSVTVSAKGDDVRSVLHDVFTSSKKNYVLEPGVRFVLYLSLKDVELEEALTLICKQAGLTYEIQNGIYFVNRAKVASTKPMTTPPKVEVKPKGTLPQTVLTKKVTTKLNKVELRALFGELSKQAGVTIEVSTDVPSYKLDAYLLGTSLKYALDSITKATGLTYTFTDNLSIAIKKPEDPNRVVVLKG